MSANPYAQYQVTRIQTASPDQLLLMLFDGALQYLHRAEGALSGEDWGTADHWIEKAAAVIEELDASLNRRVGGELGEVLHRLYSFSHCRLIQARRGRDAEACPEVARLLKEVRDGFAEAERILRATGSRVRKGPADV